MGVPETLLSCGHVSGDQGHNLTANEERGAPLPLRSKGEDDPLLEQGGGVGPTHQFLARGGGGRSFHPIIIIIIIINSGSEISEFRTQNPSCMIESCT